jgi:hypothetical protein
MTHSHEGPNEPTDYTPNFILPRHGVITADNWLEYEARGFEPIDEPLHIAQALCGVEHVYTGQVYDDEADFPMPQIPGIGVYADAEGLDIAVEKYLDDARYLRELGRPPTRREWQERRRDLPPK